MRRLMQRDPDFRVPEAPEGMGNPTPLRDGYAVTNRASKCFDGSYRLESSAKRDEPDYSRLSYTSIHHSEED